MACLWNQLRLSRTESRRLRTLYAGFILSVPETAITKMECQGDSGMLRGREEKEGCAKKIGYNYDCRKTSPPVPLYMGALYETKRRTWPKLDYDPSSSSPMKTCETRMTTPKGFQRRDGTIEPASVKPRRLSTLVSICPHMIGHECLSETRG